MLNNVSAFKLYLLFEKSQHLGRNKWHYCGTNLVRHTALRFHISQGLRLEAQPAHDLGRQRIGGVNVVEASVQRGVGLALEEPQQQQAADAKVGVEDVGHVARAVGDAAVVLVLALHDEVS